MAKKAWHSSLVLVASILTLVGLSLIKVDETKVAWLRLEPKLSSDLRFRDDISQLCPSLKAATDSLWEKRVIEKLALPERGGGDPCHVRIVDKRQTQFYLRTFWEVAIDVSKPGRAVGRNFYLEFPRPLAFFPLVLFLFLLLTGYWDFKLWPLFIGYVFTLSGFNLLHAFTLSYESVLLALNTDKAFVGLSLLALFLSLYRSRKEHAETQLTRPAGSTNERSWGFLFTTALGLWSPAFFTLASPILSFWTKKVHQMRNFFQVQTVLLALSLYFLTVNLRYLNDFWEMSVTIPRYFTFALFLFFLPSLPERTATIVFWKLPRFYRHLGLIAAVEMLAFVVPVAKSLPTLTRIGIALLASEITANISTDWRRFQEHARKLLSVIFLASFMSALSVHSGVTELSLVLWEPRIHPSGLMLFTFIAGMALGFVTGSVSTTFFTLAPVLTKFYHVPLVRAALIDGIAAGVLLSPLSLFNLIPSAHYHLRLFNLIGLRFRELWIPLAIGAMIYTVSAIPTVAILRPVTFIFLCMVAIALRLKQVNFKLGKFWREERNDSHSI